MVAVEGMGIMGVYVIRVKGVVCVCMEDKTHMSVCSECLCVRVCTCTHTPTRKGQERTTSWRDLPTAE